MTKFLWMTVMALTLVIVATVQQPSRASAEVTLCITDPTLVVNGEAVHIEVGVPKNQVKSVTGVTLIVEVPAGVRASLSGTHAARGIGRLGIKAELSFVPSAYDGAGPVPVNVTATVAGLSGRVTTTLSAWQPSVGELGHTSGPAGTPLSLPLAVQQ